MKALFAFFFALIFISGAAFQVAAQTSDAKLRSTVTLSLSSEAISAGIGGRVSLAVKVNADGTVKDARMLSGPSWPCGSSPDSLLDEVRKMAAANIKRALFTPAMKQGKAVSSELVMSIDLDAARREIESKRTDGASESSPRRPISGGVLNGKAKALPGPDYPVGAKANRVSGAVTVQVLIGHDGDIVSAGSVSGHPALQRAARDAACRAKFPPTTLEGKRIEVSGVITYVFR
jgi:TonB family protein